MPRLSIFDSYYRLRPVNATFTGLHAYDHVLPDWSRDGIEDAVHEMRTLRQSFDKAAATARGPLEEIDAILADAFLAIQIAELEGAHFQRRNPSLHVGEGIFSIVGLMLDENDLAHRIAERGEAMAARLRSLPRFLHDALALIDRTPIPELWIARTDRECVGAQQLFGQGLLQWCSTRELPPSLRRSIEDGAAGALAAVREFQQWLQRSESAGETAYGCGTDCLDLLISRGHQLTSSRTELLARAREQFGLASTKWDELALSVDGVGWEGVRARLDQDCPRESECLETFHATWEDCRLRSHQHDLVTWSDLPVRYCLFPAWARRAAPRLYFLNYRSPPPLDLPSTMSYFVPTAESPGRMPAGMSTNAIKLNHVAHHGAIGHHVQNFHAYRSASRIGRVAAVDCASRIGMFCGGTMAEGWACYATDLMEEVGFCTALESVAMQQGRVRQLARAIVDIELHQHTMDAIDAHRFLVEQARMEPPVADREVTRISMFPGTGLMYWVGTDTIHRLRTARQSSERQRFSLRAFHDELLSYGSIPVSLIARTMTPGEVS